MALEQRLLMVGAFPPPMHGMAAVNAAVRERLLAAGAAVRVLDIAAPSLQRGLMARLGRLPRVLRALVALAFARRRRGQALYMSVSGGFGQVYEVMFVALGRLRGMRPYLHHHSYAYLDRRSRLTAALLRVAGADTVHVVLSPGMAHRLQATYPHAKTVVAVSNAALLLADSTAALAPRCQLASIGFLGNLSAEKGIFVFLDVCAVLQARGLAIQCLLAGPFQDEQTELLVRQRLAGLPNVRYLGPQYGADKLRFYLQIDALLFPTQYVNEAEPLVILEAMAAGVPVIAIARGAIAEVVDGSCGHVVAVNGDFAVEALSQLDAWLIAPETLIASSRAAAVKFASLRQAGALQWDDVQAQIIGHRVHTKIAPSRSGAEPGTPAGAAPDDA